ncbi:unnamed protein product [Closterium sp. NIES-54]
MAFAADGLIEAFYDQDVHCPPCTALDDSLPSLSTPPQGARALASRFRPMAFAADGLRKAFYDPDVHCPIPAQPLTTPCLPLYPPHQGVRVLASRFRSMAFAADGPIEAFYDPDVHCSPRGSFFVGLQFHPERMRHFLSGRGVCF